MGKIKQIKPVGNALESEQHFGDLEVEKLEVALHQKEGTTTAWIRQQVTTYSKYNTVKVDSDMGGNLFGVGEFKFVPREIPPSVENRIAFMLVPVSTSLEEVRKRVKEADEKGAVIYRILDCKPILDSNQKAALNSSTLSLTIDKIADRQVCRYPEGHSSKGKLITYKPKSGSMEYPMYRRTFFSEVDRDDIDWRGATIAKGEVHYTATIMVDLAGVSSVNSGQTLEAEVTMEDRMLLNGK